LDAWVNGEYKTSPFDLFYRIAHFLFVCNPTLIIYITLLIQNGL
jgi:hypothetical protein